MVDDLISNFFSPNIIIGESIGISRRELNKVHDIYAQFVSDKKNKGMTQIYYNLSQMVALYAFVHLVHFPCTVNVVQMYSDAINE